VGAALQTVDGRTITGLIARETDASLTLLRAQGASDLVRRDDLELIRSTGVSLMPEGFEKDISPQQMRDLIGYIRGDDTRK